jgi:hypothetical protein
MNGELTKRVIGVKEKYFVAYKQLYGKSRSEGPVPFTLRLIFVFRSNMLKDDGPG